MKLPTFCQDLDGVYYASGVCLVDLVDLVDLLGLFAVRSLRKDRWIPQARQNTR
jgi:hypothetical protein